MRLKKDKDTVSVRLSRDKYTRLKVHVAMQGESITDCLDGLVDKNIPQLPRANKKP